MIIFLFNTSFVFAQDCDSILEKAENNYENGILRDIPNLLSACIKNGFSKSQKEQSYKLLTLTYLYLDDMDKAESYMLKLLKSNPQFKVSSLDPPELIYLYNGFRTNSVFSISFKGGINNTYINNKNINGIDNIPVSYHVYKSKLGYQFGLGFDFRVWKGLQLSGGFNVANSKINQIDSLKTTLYTDTERPFGYNYTSIISSERQFWVEMPLQLKYEVDYKKLTPYFYGGVSLNYLFGTNLSIIRVNADPSDLETPQRSVTGPDIKLLENKVRTQFHYAMLFGAGVKMKLGYDFIVFDMSYVKGMTNLRNTKAPLDADSELVYRYGYVDNDFSINSARFSVGYVKPFYKPKKLKRRK